MELLCQLDKGASPSRWMHPFQALLNKAQARFQSPFLSLPGILVQSTTCTPIHDNPGHSAVMQCGLCYKTGLCKALRGLWVRLVHSAWVGVGKGSQRTQRS